MKVDKEKIDMKKFIEDFKKFALKGNVVDLAVGVIIGNAFSKIVTSLVNDIITPFLSLLTGNIDLSEVGATLTRYTDGEQVILKYGAFIQNVIDFLIIALSIFMVIRVMSKFKRKEEEKPKEEEKAPEDVLLLREIRDLLKEKEIH